MSKLITICKGDTVTVPEKDHGFVTGKVAACPMREKDGELFLCVEVPGRDQHVVARLDQVVKTDPLAAASVAGRA